jgi:hypothetical protein
MFLLTKGERTQEKKKVEELLRSDKHFFYLCEQWQESALFSSVLNNKLENLAGARPQELNKLPSMQSNQKLYF